MGHLFESFSFLNRGSDVRELEDRSLRSVFLWLLPLLFVLGMLTSMVAYEFVRQHRVNWLAVVLIVNLSLLAFRSARIIYRRIN
jgi:hypothetical protein